MEEINVIFWIIVGLCIFGITAFAHMHLYKRNVYDGEFNKYGRYPFPIWLIILIFVLSMIPIANVAIFIIGGIIYLMQLSNDEYRFSFKNINGQQWDGSSNKFFDKIKNIFIFDINNPKEK